MKEKTDRNLLIIKSLKELKGDRKAAAEAIYGSDSEKNCHKLRADIHRLSKSPKYKDEIHPFIRQHKTKKVTVKVEVPETEPVE